MDVDDAFARLAGTGEGVTLAGAVAAVAATLSAVTGAAPAVGAPAASGPATVSGGPPAAGSGVVPAGHPLGTAHRTPQHTARDLLDALMLVRWAQTELSVAEYTLMESARRAGVSWQALAAAVGVASRQAAERRFLRLTPQVTAPPEPAAADAGARRARTRGGAGTRDGRVRAERDRRAGQRAVDRWANDNTANLRRLAGQITAIPDLHRAAGGDIDRLHDALADTDAVALPELLANARRHLVDHPDLADQIDTITARTTQVRDDTHRRRHQPDT